MAPRTRDGTESPNWPLPAPNSRLPDVDPALGATDATQASVRVQARKSVVEGFNLIVQLGGVILALSFGVFAVLSYRASDNALTATKMSNQIALLQWCTSSTNNDVTRPICDNIYAKTNLNLIVLESYGPPAPPPDDENSRGGWIFWIVVLVYFAVALLMLLSFGVLYGIWKRLVWRTWRVRRRQGLRTRWRDLPEVPNLKRMGDPIEEKMLNA